MDDEAVRLAYSKATAASVTLQCKTSFDAFVQVIFESDASRETALQQFISAIEKVQEQPHLLDDWIEGAVQSLSGLVIRSWKSGESDRAVNVLLQAIYAIFRLRPKRAHRFLFQDVDVWELVQTAAESMPSSSSSTATRPEGGRLDWQASYVLLIWVAHLLYLPFHLDAVAEEGTLSGVDRVYKLAQAHITRAGRESEAAARILSRLSVRADTGPEVYARFLHECIAVWEGVDAGQKVSYLSAICVVTKQVDASFVMLHLTDNLRLMENVRNDADALQNQTVMKHLMKFSQRLGLHVLREWEKHGEEDVPHDVEDVINVLLDGTFGTLTSPRAQGGRGWMVQVATDAKYSAAKGIARITRCLSAADAVQVVDAVNSLFEANVFYSRKLNRLDKSAISASAWHGGALCLAELARRGLIAESRLGTTVENMLQCLEFEQYRGHHSIGANVRDTGCYIAWALLRAYPTHELEPYANRLATHLVLRALFDREISVRRAASAAFQEGYGHHGFFPHGLALVSSIDFFAVGSSTRIWTQIVPFVFETKYYRQDILDMLCQYGVSHWDYEYRTWAASCLHKLAQVDPAMVLSKLGTLLEQAKTCEEPHVIHGSLLFVARIVSAEREAAAKSFGCEQKLILLIESIASRENLPSMLCEAIAEVVEAIAYLDTIDTEAWARKLFYYMGAMDPTVRAKAGKALTALDTFHAKHMPLSFFMEKSHLEVPEQAQAVALALGKIKWSEHRELLRHGVELAIYIVTHGVEAKTRAEALRSLSSVCYMPELREKLPLIGGTLLRAFCDYEATAQGDVGSFVRLEAITMVPIMMRALEGIPGGLQRDDYIRFTSLLVKQAAERIEKLKQTALKILRECSEQFAKRYFVKCVLPHFSPEERLEKSPQLLTALLEIPEYRKALLTGLMFSAGGPGESSARSAIGIILSMNNFGVKDQALVEEAIQISLDAIGDRRVMTSICTCLDLMLCAAPFHTTKVCRTMIVRLVNALQKEAFQCRDISKMKCIVGIYSTVSVLGIERASLKCALNLVNVLQHPLAVIRNTALNHLAIFAQCHHGRKELLDLLLHYDWTQPPKHQAKARETIKERIQNLRDD